jgi:hypothetical protein
MFDLLSPTMRRTDPISAGDCKGNPARVLSSGQLDAQHASCEIVPMQWACNNVSRTSFVQSIL